MLSLILLLSVAAQALASPSLQKRDVQVIGAVQSKILNPDGPKDQRPEEDGGHFQGDISLNKGQDASNRNALKNEQQHWPKGSVCYMFDNGVSDASKTAVKNAIADFEKYSCIRFHTYDGKEKDCIKIIENDSGCWSKLGKVGGIQPLSLSGNGCRVKGVAIHEIMHALGFDHEQNRFDRDKYLNVLMENIVEQDKDQFKQGSEKFFTTLDYPYDYSSVMHYGPYYFSKNDKKTMDPIKPNTFIGNRQGFSELDVKKLNKLYKCSGNYAKVINPDTTCPHGDDLDPNCPELKKTPQIKAANCANKQNQRACPRTCLC